MSSFALLTFRKGANNCNSEWEKKLANLTVVCLLGQFEKIFTYVLFYSRAPSADPLSNLTRKKSDENLSKRVPSPQRRPSYGSYINNKTR